MGVWVLLAALVGYFGFAMLITWLVCIAAGIAFSIWMVLLFWYGIPSLLLIATLLDDDNEVENVKRRMEDGWQL